MVVLSSRAYSVFAPMRALEAIQLGNTSRMFGKPGGGLLASTTLNRGNAVIGAKGEECFAKALKKHGILDQVDSFWSIAMPSKFGLTPDAQLQTDIDCIITVGDTIFLIDVKMYQSGAVTY